ncbi:unnamed protein product [Larinioides sclopetarius]|uniref:Uncharacterized protein n=1 Tax=Larinioides sclopetarius TaxID=280406 RepID=A0AAV1ZJC7_9ARAC
MNVDDEYCIPDKIDESLSSVAVMAKEILKDKYIIGNMMQKYIIAYNKTSNTRCSSKSLEVMNQNHKPVFSTITSSEVIKNTHCSSVSAEKNAEAPCVVDNQFRTPRKTNRISSNTERKRLSFDVAEVEGVNPVQAFTEDCDKNKMRLNFRYDDKVQLYDNLKERLDGIPESVASLPFHDQAAADISNKTPVKNETIVITPEKENGARINFIVNEELNPWYVKCRPSIFRCEKVPTLSDSPVMFIQERFNLEGKPETITSLDSYDDNDTYLPTKTADSSQMMVISPEKKNSTPANYAIDGSIPSFFTSDKENKTPVIHNKNEHESFRPNEEIITDSSLQVTPLKTSCVSNKTPDQTQASLGDNNKEGRKSINENAVRRETVKIATNNKENISPKKDIKTPNKPKIKKRKFVVNSEKSLMSASLVTADEEFMVPSKISKTSYEFTIKNENSTISSGISVTNGNDSICSTDESLMDASSSFHSADNSATDGNDSINRADDGFTVDQDVAQSDGKSIISTAHVNNCENVNVSLAKKPERTTYQTPIKKDCASFFTPEFDQNKITEVKSDIRNPSYDKDEIVTPETKEVESLTNLMEDLGSSVKCSDVSPFHKSMTNRSGSDDATLVGKLPLQENVSKNAAPQLECLISNETNSKQYNTYVLQAKTFTKLLKHRKTRFSIYRHIFVEDKDNLNFICEYIEMLASVIEKIPVDADNAELIKSVQDFASKGLEITFKAKSWVSIIEKDLEVWENCIQKIYQIEQDVKRFFRKKKQVITPKDFSKWEASYKIVNKKADDMILLREIRRPTIIQIGYRIQNLIQLFIQCMLLVGLLKHSSKNSSD